MTSAIQFGSKQIDFHLEYSNRKSLGITVKPDLSVLVKAPFDTSLEKVKEKLRKKAPWIIRQQSFFLYFHPKTPARKYISGETHLYLGRQYRLKVKSEKLKMKNGEVKLKGQFLEVLTNDKNKVKELVEEWYLVKARDKLYQIAKPLFEEFAAKHHFSLFTFHLSLKNMPTRWGSCTPKGKIILNPELIKAPKGCIEYVIIHELCHLVHHDHTQKFIDLQTKEMQDWEKWKMKLEKLLA
ncbi:MAG TPA: SprT family zinc-dependent metalloprotease [Bacteroidales bacterium]|nr:SprT family zinc-dependent metalloprotease [Bacteroidales bacterium]